MPAPELLSMSNLGFDRSSDRRSRGGKLVRAPLHLLLSELHAQDHCRSLPPASRRSKR